MTATTTEKRPRRAGQRLRFLIADPDERPSLGTYLRKRRWDTFQQHVRDFRDMRVLDLGGTVVHWQKAALKPRAVTVVNLLPEVSDAPWITAVQGDACELPPEVSRQTYDLVYSNSLLEHVGGYARRAAFADNVRRLAPHHWVQTPYRYFPIEPHWLFPGLQFLPVAARAAAIRRWPLAPARPDPQQALRDVLEVELVSRTELQYIFGDSQILSERVLGLTKSLIATR